MWSLFRAGGKATRRQPRMLWSECRIEDLEARALLSAGHGASTIVETSQAQEKTVTPKLTGINGTYSIHSSSGNTGTYSFAQTGLNVAVTVNTAHYTGNADIHFKTEHSKVAKGSGEFTFTGEGSPSPIKLKIKFIQHNGELVDFKYKYHTLTGN